MKNIKENIERISMWLKDYTVKYGFKGFVLGLSGGVDSAVSLALAIKAVGKENVHCFALPCTGINEWVRYEDIEHSKILANTFDVSLEIVRLNETLDVLYGQLNKYDKEDSLVMPNIKARLRMVTLRALAEELNCLVLGTTNKTEEYLGYFTKAGDGGAGVDIEPIAGFFKYEVKELARELGIPDEIIDKKSSAGLWYDQTDEDEIGFAYDIIDKYLSVREEYTGNDINNKYEPSHLKLIPDGGMGIMDGTFNMKDVMKSMSKIKHLRIPDELIDRVEEMIMIGNHKRNNPPYFKR